MAASPPPSSEQKQNIPMAMGYPSMDPYIHPAPTYMHPPQHPAPAYMACGPQGYAPHPYAPNPPYYPYNDFYYPQQHYNHHLVHTEPTTTTTTSSSFGRVMILLMFALIASMSTMTLITWFLFGTYVPEFEIVSIKVSNFSVNESGLKGTWDIVSKVSDPNRELGIRFDNVHSSVLYKEEMLGVSAVGPFEVPHMQTVDLSIKVPADQPLTGGTLPMLKQDLSNGAVVFSLRMAMSVNFMARNMVYRRENVGVLCQNMQVVFSTETGEGTMLPGLRSMCLIRLNEGLKES